MSYDASIIFTECTHCKHKPRAVEIGNMTSNVGAMYYATMPGPYPGGGKYDGTLRTGWPECGGLLGLSGLSCAVAAPIMRAGIEAMQARAAEMRALAPDNGWGDYDGAVKYLQRCLSACEEHPDGIFAVNW